MKKNLVSILILALLVVNLVLTSVMMFSTMGSVKKTGALVSNIATVLNIELDNGTTTEEGPTEVSFADMTTYDIAEKLTIPLRKGEGETKDSYCVVTVSLWMNTKDADYEAASANLASYENVFKSIIVEVVREYTLKEAQEDSNVLCEAICKRIQETLESKFIYKVTFSSILFG